MLHAYFFKNLTVHICHNNLKRSSSPERGPEEINTMGVCSFQDLGDLGEQKCKIRIVKIIPKVQLIVADPHFLKHNFGVNIIRALALGALVRPGENI